MYTPNPGFEGVDSFEYIVEVDPSCSADALPAQVATIAQRGVVRHIGRTTEQTQQEPADLGGTTTIVVGQPSSGTGFAQDDSTAVLEDTPTTIDVLANDDIQGDTAQLVGIIRGQGRVTINADNTVTYTPPPGFAGGRP